MEIKHRHAKEWLQEFYPRLHPESTDLDFEKFIMRIQRDVLFNLAWQVGHGEQKMLSNVYVRDELIKMANQNKVKEEQNQP